MQTYLFNTGDRVTAIEAVNQVTKT